MLVEVPLKDAIARLDLRRNSEGEKSANFSKCSRSNQWPDTRRGHSWWLHWIGGGEFVKVLNRVCIYWVDHPTLSDGIKHFIHDLGLPTALSSSPQRPDRSASAAGTGDSKWGNVGSDGMIVRYGYMKFDDIVPLAEPWRKPW